MKHSKWLELVEALALPTCSCPNYALLSKRYSVPEGTLRSIYTQEQQRKVIQNHKQLQDSIEHLAGRQAFIGHKEGQLLNRDRSMHVCRYQAGMDFMDLCCAYSCPPCILIRRLLEHSPWKLGRQRITDLLRRPDTIFNLSFTQGQGLIAKMHQSISLATVLDPDNSPDADLARQAAGAYFERQLIQNMLSLKLAFWTEDVLRFEGFFKTPDAKLQVPFLSDGCIVFWIDSKATFGGECIHRQQFEEQYQKYVHRYGSGMVIYWFGVIDEHRYADEDVILRSQMPEAPAITKLPCIEVSALSTAKDTLIFD